MVDSNKKNRKKTGDKQDTPDGLELPKVVDIEELYDVFVTLSETASKDRELLIKDLVVNKDSPSPPEDYSDLKEEQQLTHGDNNHKLLKSLIWGGFVLVAICVLTLVVVTCLEGIKSLDFELSFYGKSQLAVATVSLIGFIVFLIKKLTSEK
ncbi:hypothetical protein ACFL2V_08800 [Pseudomonadota bacterium]